MHLDVARRVALQRPGQAHQVGIGLFAAGAPHVVQQFNLLGRQAASQRHRLQAGRQRAPGAAQVAPAVPQFVGGNGFDQRAHQPGRHAVQRGLRLGVVAHRQHQLATAVDKGHAHRRLARCGLRLHHDVQRQPLIACIAQHRQGRLEPAPFGGRQFDARCDRTEGQQRDHHRHPPPLDHVDSWRDGGADPGMERGAGPLRRCALEGRDCHPVQAVPAPVRTFP